MTINEYIARLKAKANGMEAAIKRDLVPVMGVIAVNHFKANFRNQSFDGQTWANVKRRDPQSQWYGFEYKGERRTSVRFTRNRATGKTQRAKKQDKLNFSRAATTRKILTGHTGELGNTITYRPISLGVRVYSPKKYAAVQNNGGTIKVFGRATRTLKARRFIGQSQQLNNKLKPRYRQFFINYMRNQ